jgi:hypothetical protein
VPAFPISPIGHFRSSAMVIDAQLMQKTVEIYVGITMVRMFHLKPRTSHAIDAGNAIA